MAVWFQGVALEKKVELNSKINYSFVFPLDVFLASGFSSAHKCARNRIQHVTICPHWFAYMHARPCLTEEMHAHALRFGHMYEITSLCPTYLTPQEAIFPLIHFPRISLALIQDLFHFSRTCLSLHVQYDIVTCQGSQFLGPVVFLNSTFN